MIAGATQPLYTAVLNNVTDYYAFGAPMPGRNYTSTGYRYGMNGKEKDDEMKGSGNSYDFGARMLDTRLGRWLSMDPLQSKYAAYSPYVFCVNSPISAVDPDGRDVYIIISYTKDGEPGHIQIAVDNYKTVMENIYDSNGNVSGQVAVQVPDKTVTVYELKARAEFNFTHMLKKHKDEPGVIKSYEARKQYVLSQNLQKKNGVVQIFLNAEGTTSIKEKIETEKAAYDEGKKKYNMTENNCVDFAAKFINQISGFEQVNPKEKIQPNRGSVEMLQKHGYVPEQVSTPNFLDKDLKEVIDCDKSCGKVINGKLSGGDAFIDKMSKGDVLDVKPKE